MNSTSFTSVDPNGAGNNDKNIDSSSTAHLTFNAAIGSGQPTRSLICGSNSDSDPEASPSVTVLRSAGNGDRNHLHHHLHHRLPSPAGLLSGSFPFSNRIQLTTKHQRTLWSRATHLEKLLILALVILFTVSLLMFMFLGSVILRQKNELNAFSNTTRSTKQEQAKIEYGVISTNVEDANQTRRFCLTPDCVKVAASVIEAIDLTTDPCEDFYVSSRQDSLAFLTRIPIN